jgi:hypothetical protein
VKSLSPDKLGVFHSDKDKPTEVEEESKMYQENYPDDDSSLMFQSFDDAQSSLRRGIKPTSFLGNRPNNN